MDKNKILFVKAFGVINILFGFFWSILYLIYFFFGVLFGVSIGEEKIISNLDWFAFYILGRISTTITFIFSTLLIMVGVLLLLKKPNARKLAIYSCVAIIVSEIIDFFSAYISAFVHNDNFFSILNTIIYIILIFISYLIVQIIYLSQPKIKEIFDDDKVKVGLIVPIIFCIVSFFMPQIGWAIKWLSGGYK